MPAPLDKPAGAGGTIMADGSAPLRICYVLSHFHPHASGAERQALAQGRELARRGHSVRVVTRSIEGQPDDDAIDGVRIHRWVRTSSLGPLFGISFVAGVVRALRRLRPHYDLIHTHQGLWESIATGAGRPLLGGAPVLIQPASSGYFGEAEEMARTKGFPWLRRLAVGHTAYAAISADIERQWLALGVPPDRMIRTASGVDSQHFRPGRASPEVESRLPVGPRVVFTGRLHPQKNLDLLLDIWPEVVARTGAALILVGDGPERDRLVERSRSPEMAGRVHFAGPSADPAEILRASDVFVLPSVAEGMSNSLLEAMATGLPCLASAIGGNTDLLAEGRSGLLIPPDDRDAWASNLVEVLGDPALRGRLGTAARARIDAEFALTAVVDRYEAIYRRMLSGLPIIGA
ncbi:glycosyltransferase family 4 protein [Tundrisphaera sp. TA3]|uniref:glycosyltransferase family 4 protein n=1 Tax=Tundrisphaera sp. TA3 TaxID=3435775 RepID=UPI003EBB4CF0